MTEKEKRGRIKQPAILATEIFFIVLFACMAVYISYYAYANRRQLLSNSYNGRQKIFLAQNVRGAIYAANGETLAETRTAEDGTEVRVYPYGEVFSHIVGYASKGRAGIESLANYDLIRSDISLSEKATYESREEKFPGNNVYTTLLPALQEVADTALGVYSGAVVASDPKTGAIYAMVSKPGFDPNEIDAQWSYLTAESTNAELLNRATQGLYPPGSTFKIVTSLEYIREYPAAYNDYEFLCEGSFTADGETIHCFHGERHGLLNFSESFAKSCNSSYANIGVSLSGSKYRETLDELLFDRALPLDLSYTESVAGADAEMTESARMQLAIGQGATAMSPMHLNMITCAIANAGVLMKPYVIDRVENANGETLSQYAAERSGELLQLQESQLLTEMMRQVVENGTGSRLKGLSYTAAGKTGSAEFNGETKESHAWFTGFAPAEDPQICVTVLIENAGTGSAYAVPVAKRIFDAYFGTE